MKSAIVFIFLFVTGIVGSAPGGDFDKLKTLVGEWETTSAEGNGRVTYQLTSNGTALLETIANGSETMVSIYHQDGETTLMTHYCSIGNQPRMRAQKSSDGKSITFNFVDIANLKDSKTGHMTHLVIKFVDADNVIEEWTWTDQGKDNTSVFRLHRVKK